MPQYQNVLRFGWPLTARIAPPPPPLTIVPPGPSYQSLKVTLGPTLGPVMVNVLPNHTIFGNYTVSPGDVIIILQQSSLTVIKLPDVSLWVREPQYNPYNDFERALWIKDMNGNSDIFPITVLPFAGQFIDNMSSMVISQKRMILRLYPLNDLTGWFSG